MLYWEWESIWSSYLCQRLLFDKTMQKIGGSCYDVNAKKWQQGNLLSSQQVLDRIKDIWRVKCQFELLEFGGAPTLTTYISAGSDDDTDVCDLEVKPAG